jgi:hypothetical protein
MTTEQYQKIVADIEKEFSQFLAKAESDSVQPLNKAEEEDKSEKEESEPKAEEKKDESPAQEASEEKKEESKEEEPKAEEKKDDDADHGYDDEDVEEMHKMYGSMSKSELNLHKGAMEKCWMAKCGEMTMDKSEKETIIETPIVAQEDTSLIKSQNESLSKENEELKKNVAELVNAMASFVTKKAPARKAVTELQYLNKSEEEVKVEAEKQLTKSEITQILSKKAQEPTLTKSDREAIDKYYLGRGGIESIRHLLKA